MLKVTAFSSKKPSKKPGFTLNMLLKKIFKLKQETEISENEYFSWELPMEKRT